MDIFGLRGGEVEPAAPCQSIRVDDDGTAVVPAVGMDSPGWGPGDTLQLVPDCDGLRLVRVEAGPRKLYVELTSECNLDCGMCIRHSWNHTPGSMDRTTLERLVAQLPGLPTLTTVNFSGFGEWSGDTEREACGAV